MANTTYVFERITQDQAGEFDATDRLVFIDSAASDLSVTSNAATGLTAESITISDGTVTRTFPANALSFASQNSGFTFVDNSSLVLGTRSATGDNFDVVSANSTVVYTFAGNDSVDATGSTGNAVIHGGAGLDSIQGGAGADFIFGGLSGNSTTAGVSNSDTILGGAGNDHLYGGDFTENVTSTDGDDTIDGEAGNDYIQGNAGNDALFGSAGEDRVYGGAGNDTIQAGGGFDTVNGNMGDDDILGGEGNDSLRGGMGNDEIGGEMGQDIILGDVGNDTINGGNGIDLVTGGTGADVFFFGAIDARLGSNVAITDASGKDSTLAGFYDTVTDFENGTDKIDLDTSVRAAADGSPAVTAVVLLQAAGATFTTASAAQVYAQQLLDNRTDTATTHEVAAIQVGADTYLFSAEAAGGTQIDSAIKLLNFTASNVDSSDFI
jgi:serralysin